MHTQTHSSLWYTQDKEVTCRRLWSWEGVGPKCIQAWRHCGSEGQTDLQRAGSRHPPALTPLWEVRTLPRSIGKLPHTIFSPVPFLMQIINTSWPWGPKMLERKHPSKPKPCLLRQSECSVATSAFRVGKDMTNFCEAPGKGREEV